MKTTTDTTGRMMAAVTDAMNRRSILHQAVPEMGLIMTGFATKHYRDAAGRPGVSMVVRVLEDGDMLFIEAPMAWTIAPDHPHLDAVLRTVIQAQGRMKMIRFEYDHRSDGELKASIHLPLMGADPTDDQIFRALYALPELIDATAKPLAQALKSGKAPPPPIAASPLAALSALAALFSGAGKPARGDSEPEDDVHAHPRFRPSDN